MRLTLAPGKRLWRLALLVLLLPHAVILSSVMLACGFLHIFNPPMTSLMLYRKLAQNQKIRPVEYLSLARIPRIVWSMVVAVEDHKFYRHPGIDLEAIRDAYLHNRALGYRLYGGSTITQQLARTLFLVPHKTYFRKYLEALIALEMDALLGKRRILELYLNYSEWGNGVFGIGAAARFHYRRPLRQLTLDELRRLVTVLSSPLGHSPQSFQRSRLLSERYRFLTETFP